MPLWDNRQTKSMELDQPKQRGEISHQEAWESLRGVLEEVYAEFGGGEAYLRSERENFYDGGQDPLNGRVQPEESNEDNNHEKGSHNLG